MRKFNRIVFVMLLTLLGIFCAFKACGYDFSNWEFEKSRKAFETVTDILVTDFKNLNIEECTYGIENGKFERYEDNENVPVVGEDYRKEIEKIKNFRPYAFDCVIVNFNQIVFVFMIGGEYIIHSYDGKKPDYSFLNGQDFYTGKLGDGWYAARLR